MYVVKIYCLSYYAKNFDKINQFDDIHDIGVENFITFAVILLISTRTIDLDIENLGMHRHQIF